MSASYGQATSRRRLGAQLRKYREDVGMTLEQAAEALECSVSKISRLETGKGLPKQRDVRDLARLYGKPAEDNLEALFRLVREGSRAGWWQEYTALLTSTPFSFDGTDRYVALENDATWLRAFDDKVFHGLLQTPSYCRAVLNVMLPHYAVEEVDRLVEFRLRRQEVLHRADAPLQAHYLVDEAVFRRSPETVDAAVMRAQLDHLLKMVSLPNVTVQVLLFSSGLVRAAAGQFSILGFEETLDQDVVSVESHAGTSFLEGDFGVDTFKHIFDEAAEKALGPVESEEWIAERRADFS